MQEGKEVNCLVTFRFTEEISHEPRPTLLAGGDELVRPLGLRPLSRPPASAARFTGNTNEETFLPKQIPSRNKQKYCHIITIY